MKERVSVYVLLRQKTAKRCKRWICIASLNQTALTCGSRVKVLGAAPLPQHLLKYDTCQLKIMSATKRQAAAWRDADSSSDGFLRVAELRSNNGDENGGNGRESPQSTSGVIQVAASLIELI